MFLKEIRTYLLFMHSVEIFVLIPGSIPLLRSGPVGTDPSDGSISPVTFLYLSISQYTSIYRVVCPYFGHPAWTSNYNFFYLSGVDKKYLL